MLLAVLAVPVLLIAAYDKWVLAPKRPRTRKASWRPVRCTCASRTSCCRSCSSRGAEHRRQRGVRLGERSRGAAELVRGADRPVVRHRQLDLRAAPPDRRAQAVKDPPLLRAAYAVLPVLVVAVIVRMITAETLDFSLVLLLLSVATGAGLADRLTWCSASSASRPLANGVRPAQMTLPEPGTVDYARSFFPGGVHRADRARVHLRAVPHSFRFDDAHAARRRFHRGEQVRLRPALAGAQREVPRHRHSAARRRGGVPPSAGPEHQLHQAPGRTARRSHRGSRRPPGHQWRDHRAAGQGRYTDGCYVGLRLSTETLGEHTHKVMSCRSGSRTDGRARPLRLFGEVRTHCRPAIARRCCARPAAGSATSRAAGRPRQRRSRLRASCRRATTS